MSHLITQYPVTRTQLEQLAEYIGEPLEPVVVSTITVGGYRDLFSFFWRLRTDAVYVPALDPAGRSLLPALQFVSMLAHAGKRYVIGADFSLREFGVLDAAKGLMSIAVGSIDGLFTVAGDWRRLRGLLNVPRVAVETKKRDCAVYLKTNLWLGIQAGGSVAHTAGVVKGLLDSGCKVEFASVESPVALPTSDSLRIEAVKPRSVYVIPREFNHYRHNRPFIDQAARATVGPNTFIYQRLSLGNYAGVVLSRRTRVPLVIEYNGSENWLAANWGTPLTMENLATKAEQVNLRHAHLVVTVSDVLRDELIERGVEPERIVNHPNGVDADDFDPERFTPAARRDLRARYGIAEDALVATFVGTFGPWHGAEILAKSVSRIAWTNTGNLRKHKLHFLFVGDGVRRSMVDGLLADSKTRDCVTITGLIAQSEIANHLLASDILISPHVPNPDGSRFFGSPTKLFEYMASGRPVIASDLDQIADVLSGCPRVDDLPSLDRKNANGAFGVLVPPEDVGALATAMIFVAENPDWRRDAGQNARKRALERFTWNHHVRAILDGLDRVQPLDAVPDRRPMRVLFNALHSKSGGGLTYLRNVLPIIAEDKSIELHVCIHADQRDQMPQDLNGVIVHALDFPDGFWRLQIREQIDVPRLARRIGADATFSPANYGPLLAPKSVILLRNALSVAFVERRPSKLAYWALVYLGTFLSMLCAGRVITVSDYARRAASGGLIGLFSDRLTVVPHGVSKSFRPPGKGEKRGTFVLAVSDLYVQKNFEALLMAMARIVPEHPQISLRIAGRAVDADYFAGLERLVARLGLGGKVEFLGALPTEDLITLYQQCLIFVFPSTVETFGNPLVEAMACGAPIACSKTAAMPEIVGNAAVFFDPRNVDSIAAAIDGLLKDDNRRSELGRSAAERARAFSWQRTVEKTVSVIKEAADA